MREEMREEFSSRLKAMYTALSSFLPQLISLLRERTVLMKSHREVNNVARLINRSLAEPDGQLSPLRNVATNELIDQFPTTPRAIRGMPSAALDTVLRALGMEIDGRIEQKRQRLRVQIGLKADSA